MWTCPNCGLAEIEAGAGACPGCGFVRQGFVRLAGETGAFVLRTSLRFGARNLAQLVGEEAVYAASVQFEIRREETAWRLYAAADTPNATLLNGQALPAEGATLREGDSICLASRREGGRTAATISVTLTHQ